MRMGGTTRRRACGMSSRRAWHSDAAATSLLLLQPFFLLSHSTCCLSHSRCGAFDLQLPLPTPPALQALRKAQQLSSSEISEI